MNKKISKILLALTILLTTKEVLAAEVDLENTYYKWNSSMTDSGNYQIKKSSKNSEGKYNDLPKIIIKDGSNNYIGYCIDIGLNLPGHDNDSISVYSKTLEEYLSGVLGSNSSKAKEITKKINEYIYFGYDIKDTKSKEKGEYYAATQQLIWEELSKAGYRSNEYSQAIPFLLAGNSTEIDLTNEKNTILNSINNYYKTPSFCSSQNKLEIAVGETATYTDNNKVLSQYEVNCSDGLTCKKNGNDLKVTVQNDSGEQTITFTKAGAGKGTTLYKEGSNQAVVINQGKVEPVSCQFGIDTYKNVQTGGSLIIGTIFLAGLSFCIAYIMYLKKTTFKVDKGA